MNRTEESFEDKLARLASETESVQPRADFALRVMARLDSQRPIDDWSTQVLRWAKVGMTVASLAAAVFVSVAWQSANAADQEEAMGYGVVEAFE
jgi:hypothetical protein